LAGELGEKYGQQHEYYNLQTPADAIKLLCINYPTLKNELVQAHQNGVGYKVIQGGAAMGYDELQLPFGSKPLLVVPVISGSGGQGTGQILLGVGLVAASFLLPGAGIFGTSALGSGLLAAGSTAAVPFVGAVGVAGGVFGTALGTALSAVGASMILSGTANLISPQPQLPNSGRGRIKGEGTRVRGEGPSGITRGASGIQSYAFTGPANTTGTGATLPVVYGRVITGSHLLAANLEVSDTSDPLLMATQTPGLHTVTINGERLTRRFESLGGLDSKLGVRDVQSSNENKRIRVEETFGDFSSDELLQPGEIISANGLDYKKSRSKRKKVDVLFEVIRGLYDNAGAPGTTKIDGFITYEMTLTVSVSGEDIQVAVARSTLQGLVNETQEFSFGHRLEIPKIKDGRRVKLDVEIIDVGASDRTKLKVQGYGYNLI
jgi:predicted phage tail protein